MIAAATLWLGAVRRYDLGRLRRNGIVRRLHHSNTYFLTPDGLRVAEFYVKVHDRLFRPLLADTPPALLPVRHVLRTLERHVTDHIAEARMAA